MTQVQSLEESIAYVKSFGLDPSVVAADGYTETHYDEFQYDENGKLLSENFSAVRVRKEWPDGFDFEHFSKLYGG